MDKNALDEYNEAEYVVSEYADNEELRMSIVKQNGEEDYLYLEAKIDSAISINAIEPKPASWYEFINDLIPVSDLENRAEKVVEDLIDAYEENEIERMESELEIELEYNYIKWFENTYDEEPDNDFRISVKIALPYTNFTAEDLIAERKLIRDNSW